MPLHYLKGSFAATATVRGKRHPMPARGRSKGSSLLLENPERTGQPHQGLSQGVNYLALFIRAQKRKRVSRHRPGTSVWPRFVYMENKEARGKGEAGRGERKRAEAHVRKNSQSQAQAPLTTHPLSKRFVSSAFGVEKGTLAACLITAGLRVDEKGAQPHWQGGGSGQAGVAAPARGSSALQCH